MSYSTVTVILLRFKWIVSFGSKLMGEIRKPFRSCQNKFCIKLHNMQYQFKPGNTTYRQAALTLHKWRVSFYCLPLLTLQLFAGGESLQYSNNTVDATISLAVWPQRSYSYFSPLSKKYFSLPQVWVQVSLLTQWLYKWNVWTAKHLNGLRYYSTIL